MPDPELMAKLEGHKGAEEVLVKPQFEEREGALWVILETKRGLLRSTKKMEHRLKPIQELFDGESHRLRIDGREERYRSLLMAIETPIVNVYRAHPDLKDKDVISALGEVIRLLDMEPIGSLGRERYRWLRVCLSLNAYTRQETLAALECVLKSVKLHKSVDGPQGYLDFIEGFIP